MSPYAEHLNLPALTVGETLKKCKICRAGDRKRRWGRTGWAPWEGGRLWWDSTAGYRLGTTVKLTLVKTHLYTCLPMGNPVPSCPGDPDKRASLQGGEAGGAVQTLISEPRPQGPPL